MLLVLGWLGQAEEVGAGRAATEALQAEERGRARALLSLMGTSVPAPGAGTAEPALSYLVTTDTLVILLSRPGTSPVWSRQPIARDSLVGLVRQVRAGLGVDEAAGATVLASRTASLDPVPTRAAAAAAAGGGGAGSLRRLARLLLPDSLLRLLPPGGEVVVVPHGALALVPFAVLPLGSGDSTLTDRHAIRYVPSLATLTHMTARPALPRGAARRRALTGSLVVGNPIMPTVLVPGGWTITAHPAPRRRGGGRPARPGRAPSRSGGDRIGGPPAAGPGAGRPTGDPWLRLRR